VSAPGASFGVRDLWCWWCQARTIDDGNSNVCYPFCVYVEFVWEFDDGSGLIEAPGGPHEFKRSWSAQLRQRFDVVDGMSGNLVFYQIPHGRQHVSVDRDLAGVVLQGRLAGLELEEKHLR